MHDTNSGTEDRKLVQETKKQIVYIARCWEKICIYLLTIDSEMLPAKK